MVADEKRQEVFNIAQNIAIEEGLSSLTIRRLAKEADISIGSVYNLFGTKDELILELIEDYWSNSLKNVISQSKNSTNHFIDKLDELYINFKSVSKEFHKDWMKDLIGIHMSNPDVLKMSDYYKDLTEARIKEILLEDEDIKDQFDENFTPEKLADFIFENIMILLRNDAEDLGFLKLVLEKCFE